MGNGDTSFDMGGGDDEAAAALLDSDVGLGINMQQTQSSYHSNKNTNFIYPYYHNNHNHLHQHQPSTEIGGGLLFGGSDSVGVMAATGKVLFTATQWQELERQTMIYKYIVASIPVPPHLLIPLSTQSNRVGMDLRFSSGSDQEPWRCRRTDGKKWRCSRDVAPDQKYCERHAHKSRPRSRKPVEIQSHNTTTTTTTSASSTNTLSATTSSYQHPRCTEWFIKSGTTPLSSSNQPFRQSMHSPRVGSKRDHMFSQDSVNYSSLQLNTSTSTGASDEAAAARRQQFIDAWSRSGGGDNCSLTLSMQCSSVGNGMDEGLQMLDAERGGDALKWHNQWSNQASWMGSPPGGPLGEALCLGTASISKGPLNVPSPHGYSTTSTTTSSSCENGGSHGRDR